MVCEQAEVVKAVGVCLCETVVESLVVSCLMTLSSEITTVKPTPGWSRTLLSLDH